MNFGNGNINIYTNCPLFRSLAKNDLYYSSFVNRGLVRTAKRGDYEAIAVDIYHRLLSFFSLEPSLQEIYHSISARWKDQFVVGMQIRVGIGRFLTTVSFFSMMIFKSLFTMPSTIQIELLNNQFGSLARILHQLKICSRNVTKIVSSLSIHYQCDIQKL